MNRTLIRSRCIPEFSTTRALKVRSAVIPHSPCFLIDNRMMADGDVYLGCCNELADAGVEILTDTEVLDIMDDGIIIINVLAAGLKPDNGLAEALPDQAPE